MLGPRPGIRRLALGALILALPAGGAFAHVDGDEHHESPMVEYYGSTASSDAGGTSSADGSNAMQTSGIRLLGHHDLGGGGFNADVWVHEYGDGRTVAFVGQWGFAGECDPAGRRGVKVVDVTAPGSPRLIATLDNPPGTTAEDVQVLRYGRRDVAMVGIQACVRLDPAVKRGLQLFDVSNPNAPIEIGFLDTGLFARGVHEFWAVQRRRGQVLAILTVPFSDTRDAQGRGDIRIADVSDPTRPVEVADWGLADLVPASQVAAMQNSGQGCFAFRFGHGADSDHAGTRAFISYWDLGFVTLGISDPTRPTFLGRTTYAPDEDGDAHSSNADGRWLFGADEDLPPPGNCKAPAQHREAGWGYLRVFDNANPASPVQVGEYRTPNSLSPARNRKGDYTIHNPVVRGDKVYASWYSDGLRVIDVSDKTRPREVASFVPPAAKDPQHVLGHVAEVWGVVLDSRGRVYLSDMNSGLWIVEETTP